MFHWFSMCSISVYGFSLEPTIFLGQIRLFNVISYCACKFELKKTIRNEMRWIENGKSKSKKKKRNFVFVLYLYVMHTQQFSWIVVNGELKRMAYVARWAFKLCISHPHAVYPFCCCIYFCFYFEIVFGQRFLHCPFVCVTYFCIKMTMTKTEPIFFFK